MPVNPNLGQQFSAPLNLGTSVYRPGGKVERLGPEEKDDAPDVPDVPDIAPAAGEGAAGAGAVEGAGAEAATGAGGLVKALAPLLVL
jgi:hypothetical protein